MRATGGNPAASIVVRTDQGRVQILDQTNSILFDAAGDAGQQFSDLPAETLGLYRSTFALSSQDFTRTPDFPTTARLFQDLWQRTNGEVFDGVISIDPVVLSHMLSVTGPVNDDDLQLPDGDLGPLDLRRPPGAGRGGRLVHPAQRPEPAREPIVCSACGSNSRQKISRSPTSQVCCVGPTK